MQKHSHSTNASLLEAFRTILTFHFGSISLETIQKLSLSPLEEFSFDSLAHISKELSLEFKTDKQSIHDIEPYMLPCIAYNQSGEAVCIMSIQNRDVLIKEKRYSNEKKIDIDELRDKFDTFLFFTKKPSQIDTLKIGDKKSKEWFYKPIKKSWRSYIEIGILTLFINIFGLALPLFTMSVYNRVIPNFAIDTLLVLGIGVAIILIFDMIFKSVRVYILEDVIRKVSNYLEEELFIKTLSLQSQYDNFLVGTKTNFFRELHVIKDFFATKLLHLLDLPFFVTAMLVIYLIDPIITIVPLIAAILLLGFNFVMQYPIASWHKKSFQEAQSKQGYLVEQLQGQEAIKLANALPHRLYKWRKIVNFYHHIQGKIQLLNGISSSISTAIIQAVSLIVIIVGVYSIHAGNLNVGGLIAVTILSARAMVPIINLSNIMIKYKQVSEALDSLNEYWHLPMENQKYNELGVGKAKGDITFDKVSFTYPNTNSPSVENISFSIKAGERVGIIGQTGAGKSTIQKLLCGIQTPQSGKIFLDDMDISTLHPVELRQNIALMPQTPYLFSGTLKENIELNQNISKEQMSLLLKKTGLIDLVKKSSLAENLDVGEMGSKLSVGQRHLVALARALMSDASIVILDEPTTGLDVSLERKLITHLKDELKDKTLIVITHRFAALELVDRVILVDNARIVADGPKEKVLQMLSNHKVKA